MNEKIVERLHEIEKKYDVKVLLAVESGSRAWGFASKDSDYDVRFVYIHRKNWYLSLVDGRDVIEEMAPDGILDFAGWDLRKALLLMSKCNSMFVEWLRSPVVYYKDSLFVHTMEKLSRPCFRRSYCMHHYYHMAVRHDERYLEKRGFELKRFMYYLRGLLAAKWAFVENDYPPVPFMKLVDALVTENSVHDELVEMVRLKSESKEHDMTIVSDKLIEYSASLQAEIESALKDQKKGPAPDIAPLDAFFLEYIDQMDEAFDWEPEPNTATTIVSGEKLDYEIRNRLFKKGGEPTAIIFVGIQGCGKTTFFRKRIEPYMKDWKHISMDELHNRNKEAAMVRECIENRQSFVIDNTNPTKEERKRYLDMLEGKGYRVMCYFFQSRVQDCIERNKLRGETVPVKAIAATSNKLELPSREEGFTDMVYIKVMPPHFETDIYVEEYKNAKTFYELLKETGEEEVISSLKTHYKSSVNDLDGYRELMHELLGRKPVFSKYQISITHVSMDDEEYEHVCGVIPGDEQDYGIEFCEREQWLGMHFTEETQKNYSPADIVAHCLWEMTFFGFRDSEVEKKKNELIESCLEDGDYYTIEDGKIIPEDF